MPDGLALAWLMFPLGAALGWYLAGRWPKPQEHAGDVSSDYLAGLAHLANQDPDQAIAAFVKAIEVDEETVELHLTLGNLFRKRGEVDRALRIHENLLARPDLKPLYQNQARFELAQDFHIAGVLDRAETLFRELVGQGMFLEPSLEALMSLQVQSREWVHAIETARQLQAVKSISLRPLIAQFYCERAEEAQRNSEFSEALRLTGRALSEHPECVRASLVAGTVREKREEWPAAIKAYQRVPEQDPRYISEVMEPLRRCHLAAGDSAGFRKFLADADSFWPHPSVVHAQAQQLQADGEDPAPFLVERLQVQPQWPGLEMLLEVLSKQYPQIAEMIGSLRIAMQKVMQKQPRYQCGHCGFTPGMLFWQCPSCQQWGSIVPRHALEEPAKRA